jgi:hypothetical protein
MVVDSPRQEVITTTCLGRFLIPLIGNTLLALKHSPHKRTRHEIPTPTVREREPSQHGCTT